MKEQDKNLRSILRVLRNSKVRSFHSDNFTVEFFPELAEHETPDMPVSHNGNTREQFKEFDPNDPGDLEVLLGGSR